jgi:hypothetical protein
VLKEINLLLQLSTLLVLAVWFVFYSFQLSLCAAFLIGKEDRKPVWGGERGRRTAGGFECHQTVYTAAVVVLTYFLFLSL